MRVLFALGLALSLGLAAGPGLAAAIDDDDDKPESPIYSDAVKLVKAENFAGAVPLLVQAIAADPKNADAFNYLGYSYRQIGDLDDALSAYGKALALEPKHRGANEYLGELYLKLGDLPKAEERLAVLDRACFLGCEEHRDLKEAIADYKAKNGS